eukprot:GSChrysophyteH1.ASY1.ANO1.437.1 assembled CDS
MMNSILKLLIVATLSVIALGNDSQCTSVKNEDKRDCGSEGSSQKTCQSAGCCWEEVDDNGVTPWCYYLPTSYELQSISKTSYGLEGALSHSGGSSNGNTITDLKLQFIYESVDTFRVKITAANPSEDKNRGAEDITAPAEADLNYELTYDESPFRFQITRKSDKETLFDFSSDLVYQDQYISFSTTIDSNSHTYGLGESTRLNQALKPATYTMWAADIPAANMNNNLYGSFPYYLQVTEGGASHGALLMNSNGMDVVLTSSLITFNVIGGIVDLYIFAGSDPKDVVKQYQTIVGKPMMQSYWSLGFHNCKYGYTDVNQVKEVVAGYQNAQIPLDTQWMDIDYMQNWRDWTWDSVNFPEKDVSSFVDTLHEGGMHFVPIVDPGIMIKSVWPGPVYYPDFLHPSTQDYWTSSIKGFHDGVKADGLWIDMNEASNFCNCTCCLTCSIAPGEDNNKYDFPTQYHIHNNQGNLGSKTIAPSAWHYGNVSAYNVHNLYGLTEQIATNEALSSIRGERPFVLTRSSFASTGVHSAKWTGDNAANWEDLQSSIVSIMDFNLFGIPMIGADICGFLGNSTEELCARWAEVGAFYPFSRNHNALGSTPQEFYLWESVTEAAQNAFAMRYKMLPYLYTLFFQAHTSGETVARSLWLNFPEDSKTYDICDQFMLGPGIMISPVVVEGDQHKDAYFPAGYWYDTPLTSVNVHIRGGTVLPEQAAAMTTTVARQSPFSLTVALCSKGGAYGELFVDDGVQLENDISKSMLHMSYKASNSNTLTATVETSTYQGPETKLALATVNILGVTQQPKSVVISGSSSVDFTYDSTNNKLQVAITGLIISEAFTLEWN